MGTKKAKSEVANGVLPVAGLLSADQQFGSATESSGIGWHDNVEGHGRLSWPPGLKAMYGISADAPMAMGDFFDGVHPNDRDRVIAAYMAATDPARRASFEIDYRTIGKEDGVVRWIAAKGRPAFDETGRCIRVIGGAIDITARMAKSHDGPTGTGAPPTEASGTSAGAEPTDLAGAGAGNGAGNGAVHGAGNGAVPGPGNGVGNGAGNGAGSGAVPGAGNGAAPRRSLMAAVRQQRLDMENRRLIERQQGREAKILLLHRSLEHASSDALTDPVTGLVNRRAFDAVLEGMIALQRPTEPAMLVLAGVDNFKGLNDAHGHRYGDAVLRIIGEILVASVRRDALVARIGGDEFALLLPCPAASDPNGTTARAIAERLCARFAEHRITMRGEPERYERITLSIGVAAWQSGERPDDWLKRAGRALYAAKRNGRNRVVPVSDQWQLTATSSPQRKKVN